MQGRAKAVSDRILSRHGGAGFLVRTSAGDTPQNPFPDPSNPEPAPDPVETLHPVQIIETGYTHEHLKDTLIQTGDLVAMLSVPADFTPTISDKLRVRGRDYFLIDIQPVQPNPDSAAVHFVVHGRR